MNQSLEIYRHKSLIFIRPSFSNRAWRKHDHIHKSDVSHSVDNTQINQPFRLNIEDIFYGLFINI
jgi:hypothetical protein